VQNKTIYDTGFKCLGPRTDVQEEPLGDIRKRTAAAPSLAGLLKKKTFKNSVGSLCVSVARESWERQLRGNKGTIPGEI